MYKICVITLLIAFFGGLIACNDAPKFAEAQPVDAAVLETFPEAIRGAYVDLQNFSTLYIDDKQVTRHYHYDYAVQKDSVPQTARITADTLLMYVDGKTEPVSLKGDSIVHHVNFVDTLFTLCKTTCLKFQQHTYFINTQSADDRWQVTALFPKPGSVTLAAVSGQEAVSFLNNLTGNKADTTLPAYRVSQQQFEQLILQNKFDSETFFTIPHHLQASK